MVTGLEKFKKEMEPARQLYAHEIRDFARRYDALGKMTMSEFPDIDTQEYVFGFEVLNGTSKKELDEYFWKCLTIWKHFQKSMGLRDFANCLISCLNEEYIWTLQNILNFNYTC